MFKSIVLLGLSVLAVESRKESRFAKKGLRHGVPPNIANLTLLTDAANNFGAVSLDGSPAAIYVRYEAETTKFYVHQEGGGWCNSDVDCYSRSQGPLGSSKGFGPTYNLGSGYFSNDPAINPLMWNWTKIYMPYTDGGSQTGDLSDPVQVPGKGTIYYRGHRILKYATQPFALSVAGMDKATDVIISGCSAGGLSTFLHADEWKAVLPATAKVAAMPDSGFFLDYTPQNNPPPLSYAQLMRWVYTRMNSTGGVPQACAAAEADPSNCIFAEHVSPYLTVPFFPLQSTYDSWQEGNDAFVKPTDNAGTNAYGALLTQRFKDNLLADKNKVGHGSFLDSCYHHCGEWDSITINGKLSGDALAFWYNNLGQPGQRAFIQGQAYPCASCCKP